VLGNLSESDIRELRVFAKVVEAGGFSAAQVELNISQSTISTHMTALENRLGMSLCKRGRAGFSVTEKGALIYQAAKRLFASLDDFRSEAGAARNCYIGNLAVGIVDNLINNPACHLHSVIAKMTELAPEVQISIHVAAPSVIEQAVLDGRFDLGLGACGRHSPYLSYQDVFDERQVLYCGRGHTLFNRSHKVEIAELKSQQFARRAYVAPDHFPMGMSLPSTAVADLMESVAVFILSGRYIGFLPEHFARQWTDQDLMRPLLERELGYKNPIYLAFRKTEQNKPIQSVFLRELRKAHGLAVDTGAPIALQAVNES